jgi:hypothetical protein
MQVGTESATPIGKLTDGRRDMNYTNASSGLTAAGIPIALSEVCPDTNFRAVPAIDQYNAVEAYWALEDDGLASIPEALAAYVDAHQRQGL